MRANRWIGLSIVVTAACASSPAAPRQPGPTAVVEEEPDDGTVPLLPRPDFLKWVPADTPYFFGALTPLDAGYATREYLSRLAAYEKVRPAVETIARERPGDARRLGFLLRLEMALLAELGGEATPARLAALGLDPSTVGAFYGLGLNPVIRIQLSDPARFAAALGRMAAKLEPIEKAALGGQRYYAARDESVLWIVAVTGRDLVVGLVPPGERASALPLLLGQRPPERSLHASRRLDRMAAEYNLSAAGLGYADLTRLAASVAGALTSPCAEELAGFAGAVPRVVIGVTQASGEEMKARSIIEVRSDLTAALLALRGEVPRRDAAAGSRPTVEIAAAVDVSALLAGFGSAADRIRSRPFRCSALAWLNDLSRGQGATVAFIRKNWAHVRGANLTIQKLDDPTQAEFFILLGTDQPGPVLDAVAQGLQVARPALEPGGPPASVNSPILGGIGGPIHVAVAPRAVGLSVGGEPAQLTDFLAAGALDDPPLLFFHLDPQPVLELLRTTVTGDPRVAAIDPDLARALAEIDRGDLGRFDELSMTFRATARGLEIEMEGRYPK